MRKKSKILLSCIVMALVGLGLFFYLDRTEPLRNNSPYFQISEGEAVTCEFTGETNYGFISHSAFGYILRLNNGDAFYIGSAFIRNVPDLREQLEGVVSRQERLEICCHSKFVHRDTGLRNIVTIRGANREYISLADYRRVAASGWIAVGIAWLLVFGGVITVILLSSDTPKSRKKAKNHRK